MTRLDTRLENKDMLLRELVYGPAKSKKTWWASKAAEAGYNVLLLDGDDGWHILSQIAPEAQKRIQVINATDELDRPVFAKFITQLLKSGNLIWDEKKKISARLKPNEDCVHIDLKMMGNQSVLILDSWTALSRSLMLQYAKENMIDLAIAEEGDDKWGYYRWAGTIATWILTQITALPCHVIVIGHVDQYEKRSKNGKDVLWSKQQVKSTSGPHSMQLPSQFSDVLYFYPKGTAFKIDTKGNEEADGGSRLIKPATYNWEDLQFKDMAKTAGLQMPDKNLPLINYEVVIKESAAKTLKLGSKPVVKPVETPVAKVEKKSLFSKK